MVAKALPLQFSPTNEIDRGFGRRLAVERGLRGMSVARLASASGLLGAQLQLVEWGWARLSAWGMVRVLRALDLSPEALFMDLLG